MKTTKHLGLIAAAAASVVMLAGASAFADSRPSDRTNGAQLVAQRADDWRQDDRYRNDNRNDERDRSDDRYGNRDDDRYGDRDDDRHGDRDDDGYRDRDAYRDGGRYDAYVRGIVEGIQFGRQAMFVRTESGRVIRIDMDRFGRGARGMDLDDFRRGDLVTLRGFWARDAFHAIRLDNIRRHRRW